MKKLLATLLLLATLFAPKAHAQLFNPPEYWLGQPVQINGLWYAPFHVNNVSFLPIFNLTTPGVGVNGAYNVEFTGTLRPSPYLTDNLPGNYWTGSTVASFVHISGPLASGTSQWGLTMYGAYQLPAGGSGDCESFPSYPSGVLAYLRLNGEGTIRLTQSAWFGSYGCPVPGHGEIWGYAVTNPIYLDTNPPVCMDCGGEGGGEEDPVQHSKAAPRKRTTWGSIKAMYR